MLFFVYTTRNILQWKMQFLHVRISNLIEIRPVLANQISEIIFPACSVILVLFVLYNVGYLEKRATILVLASTFILHSYVLMLFIHKWGKAVLHKAPYSFAFLMGTRWSQWQTKLGVFSCLFFFICLLIGAHHQLLWAAKKKEQ